MVDLLGKNELFEPMWDAIRSMKHEGALSVPTFISVFWSYCHVGRSSEAIMTFDVMERYGVEPSIVAVNALLSAICSEGNQTLKAVEFFDRVKTKISPNADSFAILLQGWEKERNVAKAKTTFGEMVIRVGWSPEYASAYDSFLMTLVLGMQVDDALRFLQLMKGKNCLPGLKFFSNALDILVKQQDSARAMLLWNLMVGSGLMPNLIMYNAMIGLFCNKKDVVNAFVFLDGMPFHGAFPDSLSYNMIFQCLIKNENVREARKFFNEMVKNEYFPSHSNYALGIKMFLDCDDPETAVELWDSMLKNCILPFEDSANALLNGMTMLDRLKEAVKFAEDMLDLRIKIHDATMEMMRIASSQGHRSGQDTFQRLAKRWKPS